MKTSIHSYKVPAIIIEPNDFQILDVNEAILSTYGYSRDELVTKPVFILVDDKKQAESIRTAEQFNGDDMFMGVSEHLTKSNQKIKVKVLARKTKFKGLPAYIVILNPA
jgi:PAS domain S-box-containing protein